MEPLSTRAEQILWENQIKRIEKEGREYRGESTMKLHLLFIGMDLLTLLAYPIVFVYCKFRQFSKSKESIGRFNFKKS
ncbi:MAG: hypothetical protein AABZ00_00070 [Chloroflexota bacterium]